MMDIGIRDANRIIELAFKHSHEIKSRPLGVVVVDTSGNIVSAQRDDGASMFRIDIGRAKAWSAVAIGASTKQLARRARENPNFFVSLAATSQGKFLPQPGGVLIKNAEGKVIGACGVSGSAVEHDEECCVYGVSQAGFDLDNSD
ncbi:MAG: GlcG/HbpS family heme-binding protein [Burkholderiales bacterium]|jgi:uncharacterized protein GlcG (DUF336 family)